MDTMEDCELCERNVWEVNVAPFSVILFKYFYFFISGNYANKLLKHLHISVARLLGTKFRIL